MKGKTSLNKRGFYNKKVSKLNLGGLTAHFVAQPSKYAQELHSMSPIARSSKVKFEEGKTISKVMMDKKSSAWANKHRFEIADQLAEMLVDFMNLGVVHKDVHSSNIIIKRGKGGKPIIKAIDFEFSKTLDEKGVKSEYRKGNSKKGTAMDFAGAELTARSLGKSHAEQEEMQRYFKRKFEKLVDEKP